MGNRVKMSRQERAKQFMPFAALKGYTKALRKKEEMFCEEEHQEEEGRMIETAEQFEAP